MSCKMVVKKAGKKVNYKKLLLEKESILKETTNSLMRLQAEFDNFRKRTENEKAEIIAKANKSFVKKLLDVIDSLEKASENSSDKEGFNLIKKQFANVLNEGGLEPIRTDSQLFDPNLHEAVLARESDEDGGQILETIRTGYKFKDEVIRPAQVIISKRGEENE